MRPAAGGSPRELYLRSQRRSPRWLGHAFEVVDDDDVRAYGRTGGCAGSLQDLEGRGRCYILSWRKKSQRKMLYPQLEEKAKFFCSTSSLLSSAWRQCLLWSIYTHD